MQRYHLLEENSHVFDIVCLSGRIKELLINLLITFNDSILEAFSDSRFVTHFVDLVFEMDGATSKEKKINAIKAVRSLTNLTLKESKEMVERHQSNVLDYPSFVRTLDAAVKCNLGVTAQYVKTLADEKSSTGHVDLSSLKVEVAEFILGRKVDSQRSVNS